MSPPQRPRRQHRPPSRPPSAVRGLGGDQVEGRQAVRELLRAGRRRVRELWIADDVDPAPIISEIEELAVQRRVTVQRVPRDRLDARSRTEAPQGVLARADELPAADVDALCRRLPDGPPPFLLALDGVTDPQNLGALLRSAEGAGVTGVVLPRHRAVHVTPTVAKAAAGAIEHVPIAVAAGVPAALSRMRGFGVWTVGLDAGAPATLYDLAVANEPVVLVLGAEGPGLSRLTKARCEVLVRIPLAGSLASLNVAAAGTLALFEVARRRSARS